MSFMLWLALGIQLCLWIVYIFWISVEKDNGWKQEPSLPICAKLKNRQWLSLLRHFVPIKGQTLLLYTVLLWNERFMKHLFNLGHQHGSIPAPVLFYAVYYIWFIPASDCYLTEQCESISWSSWLAQKWLFFFIPWATGPLLCAAARKCCSVCWQRHKSVASTSIRWMNRNIQVHQNNESTDSITLVWATHGRILKAFPRLTTPVLSLREVDRKLLKWEKM